MAFKRLDGSSDVAQASDQAVADIDNVFPEKKY